MNLASWIEHLGDGTSLAIAGLLIGLVFGACAHRSGFCMRAAAVEASRGQIGGAFAVWLIGFATTILIVQAAILAALFDPQGARQIATGGSIAGAVIGGLVFGVGMVLAGGCASRLVVLAAGGNLRALITGLVLVLVAQATIRGALSPLREVVTGLWTIEAGPGRNLLHGTGGATLGVLIGIAFLATGIHIARRAAVGRFEALTAGGVGVAIASGWLATYGLSFLTFEPARITSVSFVGPSVETLFGILNARVLPLTFDTGLIPGVVIGAFLMAAATHRLQLQGFESGPSMLRYLTGATLMGFGGVLAVGCTVGAGVTGGALFAVTAWLSLAAMWISSIAVQRVTDSRKAASTIEQRVGNQQA